MGLGIILGTLVVLCSRAWPLVWLGFELNLMSFLILALSREEQKKPAIVYYIAQRAGSLCILITGMLGGSPLFLILLFSLLLKLGVIPLHFWVPQVLPSLSKICLYLVQTWQKVAPLTLFLVVNFPLDSFMFLNVWLGGVAMLTVITPMFLVIYSGFIQMGWVIGVTGHLFWWYLGVYFFVALPLVMFIDSKGRNFGLSLLNAGGLPPLSGFMLKLKVLCYLNGKAAFTIVMARAVALVSYMRILLAKANEKQQFSLLLLMAITVGLA